MDPIVLIEWIYDPIEERYGRVAAWFATMGAGLLMIGILVWILLAVVSK